MSKDRIKILHVITSFDIGGAEIVLYHLLKNMDADRFENQVVSLIPPGPVGEKIQALFIPVFSLGMRPGYPSPGGLFRLSRLLRRESPDVVQTWLYHADLLGLLAAKLTGLPVLWNIRGSYLDMSHYNRWSTRVRSICARLSAFPKAVVVNSRAGEVFHERIGYHPQRWVYIPNGIDTGQFQPDKFARTLVRNELGLEQDSPLIGLVARFDPMKDHENFMRAASLLAAKFPNVHFVLVGKGAESSTPFFGNFLGNNPLHGRLHLLGQRDDIPNLMAALDIASLSSYGEGFPNTIAEAMSCGIPCVATDVGDSSFLIGDTGLVVPPKDPQALADAWERILSLSAEERLTLGEQARQRIQQLFSISQVARRYEVLYEQVLDRQPVTLDLSGAGG